MSDPLSTYLHDHVAGAKLAVNILETMADRFHDEPLGPFSTKMLTEIKEDEAILNRLIDRMGSDSSSRSVKQALSWMGEKSSRFKLHRKTGDGLGTLQALETVSLGILGKRALWRVLAQMADQDQRLSGENFPRLADRAQTQFELVEERRLDAAWNVFSSRIEPAPAPTT